MHSDRKLAAAGAIAAAVCAVLSLSQANQRVLPHRGRSQLRRALEAVLAGS
jgi:hypothetical protein